MGKGHNDQTDGRQRRQDLACGLIVALLAAVVAGLFIVESHRHEVFQYPMVDAATYYRQARAIVSGDSPTGQMPYWQPPLYPYSLALMLRAGVRSSLALRLAHGCLLSGAAAFLTFALAKRFLSRRISRAAGLAACCYGPLVFFASQLLPAAMAAVLAATGLLLTLRLKHRPSLAGAALCGVAYGLAALTVSNTFVIALLAALWVSHKPVTGSGQEGAGKAGVLLLAMSLCILPVTIRNFVVSGEFVPISTNAGINLHIGNGLDADQRQVIRPGIDWDRLVGEPFRAGAARNESQADRYFKKRVLRFVVSHPIAAATGLIKKAIRLVNAREIPRNIDMYACAGWSSVLRLLVWRAGPFAFPFGILGPLAVIGLVASFRKRGDARFIAAAVLVYAGSIVAFFPTSRYTVPMLPPLIAIGALGCMELVHAVRGKEWRLPVILGCSFVLINFPVRFPTDSIPFDSELLMYTGISLQTRGHHAESIRMYEAALERDPENADAWFYLGTAARESGDAPRAIMCHRQALDIRPDHHRAMQDLATLLHARKQTEQAVDLLRQCIELDPGNRKAMRNLAIGLLDQGNVAEATEWFRRSEEQSLH